MTRLLSCRAGGKNDFGFADAKVEMPTGNVDGRVQMVGRRVALEFRSDTGVRNGNSGAARVHGW